MSASTPTVSVVIPVFNGERTIALCLQAVLAQTYPRDRFEVIVVENGSTDATSAIVAQHPVTLLHSERRGPAAARNVGIARASGEIVAFTDADCIPRPDWLKLLIQPYRDARIGGTCGPIRAYQHPGRTLVELFSDYHSPLRNYKINARQHLPHLYTANASYRRDILHRAAGFREGMFTGEDVDLAWRVQLDLGCEVALAEDAEVLHWHRATLHGLARQYRQYGFGEVLLDALYRDRPGYPRTPRDRARRLLAQASTIPTYLVSSILRRVRFALGRATAYEALEPRLWLTIEGNNILGQLHGLVATRFMRDPAHVLERSIIPYLKRYY